MPWPTPGEKKDHYMIRAIPAIMADTGKEKEAAVAQAYGMWKQKRPKKKKKYEGVDLSHAYPVEVLDYDQEDYRAFLFEIADETPYAIYLEKEDITADSPEETHLAMDVRFGPYDGTVGGLSYEETPVGIREMYRIFATVMKMVADEIERDPKISALVFCADKDEVEKGKEASRRMKAYRTIVKEAADKLDWHYAISPWSHVSEIYYVLSPNIGEKEIIALMAQHEDMALSAGESYFGQQGATELYKKLQINEGISKKYYWPNGGPTRHQNKPGTFDDVNSHRAGMALDKGFDLNKREVTYSGPVVGETLHENSAEDFGDISEFQSPTEELTLGGVRVRDVANAYIATLADTDYLLDRFITIYLLNRISVDDFVDIRQDRSKMKTFYKAVKKEIGRKERESVRENKEVGIGPVVGDSLHTYYEGSQKIYEWETLRGEKHRGPIVETDGNVAYVECQLCGKTLAVEDGVYDLPEFFKSLEEDMGGVVGLSANFQNAAPEHMLSMNGVPSQAHNKGTGNTKHGKISDTEWDSAYTRTRSEDYLRVREETFKIQNTTLPQKGRLLQKGVVMLAIEEHGQPQDVMPGPPNGYIAYGRGWVDRRSQSIAVDGGPNGSGSGHPPTAQMGFYWGVTEENPPHSPGRVLFLRGRSGATPEEYENFFKRNISMILDDVYKRVPRL